MSEDFEVHGCTLRLFVYHIFNKVIDKGVWCKWEGIEIVKACKTKEI